MTKDVEHYRRLTDEIAEKFRTRPTSSESVMSWTQTHIAAGHDMPTLDELRSMNAPPVVLEFAEAHLAWWAAFNEWRATTPITGPLDRLQQCVAIFGKPCVWLGSDGKPLAQLFDKLDALGPERFKEWALAEYAAPEKRKVW